MGEARESFALPLTLVTSPNSTNDSSAAVMFGSPLPLGTTVVAKGTDNIVFVTRMRKENSSGWLLICGFDGPRASRIAIFPLSNESR